MSVHTSIIFVLFCLAANVIFSRAHDEVALKKKKPAGTLSDDDYAELSSFWHGLPQASRKVEKPWKYNRDGKNSETRRVESFESGDDDEFSSDLKVHRFDDFMAESLSNGRGKKQRRFAIEQEDPTPEEPQHFVHPNYGHQHHSYDHIPEAPKVSLVDLIYRLLSLYGDIQKLVQAHPDKTIYENLQISIYEIIEELVHDKLPRMMQEMIAEMRSDRTRHGNSGRSKKAVDEELSARSNGRASPYMGNSRTIQELGIARNIMEFLQRPRFTWWQRANGLEGAGDKATRNLAPRDNQESTLITGFPNRYRIANIFPDNTRGNGRPIDGTEYDRGMINEQVYDQRYEMVGEKPATAPIQEMGDTDMNRNIYEQGFMGHQQWQNPMKRDTSLLAINYASGEGEGVVKSPRVVRYAENIRRPEKTRRSEVSKDFHEPATSDVNGKIGKLERSENIGRLQPAERLSRSVKSEELNRPANPPEFKGAGRPVNNGKFQQPEEPAESAKSEEIDESGEAWELEDLVESGRLSKSNDSRKSFELPSSEESARFREPDSSVMSGKPSEWDKSAEALKLGESRESENSKTSVNSKNSEVSYKLETLGEPKKLDRFQTIQKFQQSERLARSVEFESEEAPKFVEPLASENSGGVERSAKLENSTRKYRATMNSDESTKLESEESQQSENTQKFQQPESLETSIKSVKLNESAEAPEFKEPAKSENSDQSERSTESENPKQHYDTVSPDIFAKTATPEESEKSENVAKFQQPPILAQLRKSESYTSSRLPESEDLKKNAEPASSETSAKLGETEISGNIQKIQPSGRLSRSAQSGDVPASREVVRIANFEKLDDSASFGASVTPGNLYTPGISEKTGEVEESEALSWSEKSIEKISDDSGKSDYFEAFEMPQTFSQPGESENPDKFGSSGDNGAQLEWIYPERLYNIGEDADHMTEVVPRYVKVIESPPTTVNDRQL